MLVSQADDDYYPVREMVAGNPTTPIDTLVNLAQDGVAEVSSPAKESLALNALRAI